MSIARVSRIVKGAMVAVALIAAVPGTSGQANARADVSGGFADLAEKLLPAVVNISTTQKLPDRKSAQNDDQDGGNQGSGKNGGKGDKGQQQMPKLPPGSPFEEFFKDFFDQQNRNNPTPRRAASLGSGFIIDAKNGYVITNNHVIADADEINVILQDDKTIRATLVGSDSKADLAVLQIKTDHKLVEVPFGESGKMRVGDWVLAIGNPYGLGGTVTAGIVSAIGRNINAGPYDDFIQTDASINRGNSGGPMFNTAGEVIGINTAIYSPTGGSVGIGFATPSDLAKPVIEQLIKYHKTRRGWLGVRIQSVTDDIAENLGLGTARGALIASVTPKGPAANGGIQAGDVVLEFDGKTVDEQHRLPRIVADTPVDKTVPVKVWRQNKEIDKQVKVGELENAEEEGLVSDNAEKGKKGSGKSGPKTSVSALGLSLSALSGDLREQYDIAQDVKGVVVVSVDPGSSASDKGLSPGDVIVDVNQAEVANPKDVADKVDEAKGQGRKSVLLLVQRRGEMRYVAVTLGTPDKNELKKKGKPKPGGDEQ